MSASPPSLSHSHRLLGSIMAGLFITLGFWFGPEIYRMLEQAEPASLPVEDRPAAVVSTAVPRPSQDVVAPAPNHTNQDRSSYREDPVELLARLRQTCEFWSARANDDRGRVFRDRACREMREYAAATRQSSPTTRRQPPATVRAPAPSPPAGIYIHECTNLKPGSINYRRCRAQESERLKSLCRHHRQREQWQAAGQWCAAYESYIIVE